MRGRKMVVVVIMFVQLLMVVGMTCMVPSCFAWACVLQIFW